jgi:hypothetical protein
MLSRSDLIGRGKGFCGTSPRSLLITGLFNFTVILAICAEPRL